MYVISKEEFVSVYVCTDCNPEQQEQEQPKQQQRASSHSNNKESRLSKKKNLKQFNATANSPKVSNSCTNLNTFVPNLSQFG